MADLNHGLGTYVFREVIVSFVELMLQTLDQFQITV